MSSPIREDSAAYRIAPVVTRILLRYLSGALVAWGLVSPETGAVIVADADLQAVLLIGVGGLLGAATEALYARARRSGGPT